MKQRFLFAAVVVLTVIAGGQSLAQLPPLIPREILFGNSERTSPQISPDGKTLAYLAPDKDNRLQIWLRTLNEQDDRQLTKEKGHGIQHYTWTYDGEHLIFALDNDGDENWHIHAVNIKSGTVRNLTPYHGVQAYVVVLDPNFSDEMLIAMNLRNREWHDVYRVHLKTGDVKMVSRNPGRQIWWVADSQFKVRVATNTAAILTKESDTGRWRPFRRWQRGDPGGLVGFSKDDKTLYIRGSHDSDTGYVLALNMESGEETVIAGDDRYDAGDVDFDPIARNVRAVGFYKEKLEWQVIDPGVAGDFAALAKMREGKFSVVHRYSSPVLPSRSLGRRDLSDKIWIVSYGSDDGPVYHYAYERAAKKATLLFSEQPKLEGLPLAKMSAVRYEARDGLTIHGYLTLPVGVPAKNLPAVLLVHGGPWARDLWGYSSTVQWLTNRGYVVLQLNYRGSSGYGKKHLTAGYKEWGGKMHNDLIDGVNWLIREGVADPKRIAIMGASYGGYATLVGLTFTPEVFAAGVSQVGISNLVSFYKNQPSYWAPYRRRWVNRVGDPEKEEEMLKSRSPLFFVDQIKVPLLIAHGKNDARVVVAESEQMVEAMRKANKRVEYVIYEDEGHRLTRPENKFHFFAKAEEFLAKHLGGRFEPAAEVKGHSGVSK